MPSTRYLRRILAPSLAAALATVAACGDSARQAPEETAAAGGTANAPAPPAGGASAAGVPSTGRRGGVPVSVAVTLGGDGSRTASGTGECTFAEQASIYNVPAKQWAARFDGGTGSVIGSANLTVWQFAGGAPDQFSLGLDVGQRSHRIATVKGGELVGSGRVTIRQQGSGVRFEVDGEDAGGTKVRTTIECERFTPAVAEGG